MAATIYVTAGCTRPAENWLGRLADGGRLILPMTSDQGFGSTSSLEQMACAGAVFRIERRSEDHFVRWISPVAIFPCAGSRDERFERALAEAFAKGGWQKVTRLYRDSGIPRGAVLGSWLGLVPRLRLRKAGWARREGRLYPCCGQFAERIDRDQVLSLALGNPALRRAGGELPKSGSTAILETL